MDEPIDFTKPLPDDLDAIKWEEPEWLICPVCNHDYTHFDFVMRKEGRVSVLFWCENGCKFMVRFETCKGRTKIETIGISSDF